MNEIEFVVVQDIFFNESCRYADVVLPAACFAEKEGVFANSDRRVQTVRKAVEPPGEARADWRDPLRGHDAGRLRAARLRRPAEIYAEMARWLPSSPASRTSGSRTRAACSGRSTLPTLPSTEYLHKAAVLRGKGLFQPVDSPPFERRMPSIPSCSPPAHALSLQRRHADTALGGSDRQAARGLCRDPSADGAQLGVEDGQLVDVVSRRGRVRCRAMVSRQVRRNSIWMPFHFPERRPTADHRRRRQGDRHRRVQGLRGAHRAGR